MPEFRLTQISDTHLARRLTTLTENFHRVSEHINATRPDLVVNSGDLAFDAPTHPDDLEFARTLHAALPVPCRHLPGNHDIGDNPTAVGPVPTHPTTEQRLQAFRKFEIVASDRAIPRDIAAVDDEVGSRRGNMFADAMKVLGQFWKTAGEMGVGNLGQAKFGHAIFLPARSCILRASE